MQTVRGDLSGPGWQKPWAIKFANLLRKFQKFVIQFVNNRLRHQHEFDNFFLEIQQILFSVTPRLLTKTNDFKQLRVLTQIVPQFSKD